MSGVDDYEAALRRRSARKDRVGAFAVYAACALAFAGMFVLACGFPAGDAPDVLEAAGYTDADVLGHRFFGCGRGDLFRSGFTATGPGGLPASDVVCCGLLKGCTVRVEALAKKTR